MNAEQRALFTQMQATMCIVEGYSNHVMNAVGRELLPNYAMISRRFAQRLQQRSQADRLLAKLTGLDVKMEQYRLGEEFIDRVVQRAWPQLRPSRLGRCGLPADDDRRFASPSSGWRASTSWTAASPSACHPR